MKEQKVEGKKSLLVAIVLCVLILGTLFLVYGYENTWRLWNIPTASPYFADLRTITGGAESHELGYDPLVNNSRDPWGRTLNYPRVWQCLFWLGINQSHTIYFGITLIGLFFVGVYLFVPHADQITVGSIVIGVLSPAVLLCLERANTDLLMFFLLSLSICTVRKHHVVSMLSVLVAFVLKLFPVFGLAVLLRVNREKLVKLAVISGVVVGVYILLSVHDLVLIYQGTPQNTSLSFGLDNLWMNVQNHSSQIGQVARKLTYLIASLLMALAFSALLRDGPSEISSGRDEDYLDSFRVGSAVYAGAFLLQDNWDYRLVFLLFAIPQLLSWARRPSSGLSRISAITLIAIYLALWHLVIDRSFRLVPFGGRVSFMLDEVTTWLAFCGLLYLLFYSMPGWVKQNARRLTLRVTG
jgi:hypothetical protein